MGGGEDSHDIRFTCDYEMRYDAKGIQLVTQCKDCVGESNLEYPLCFSGLLNALSREYHVDQVTLSDYTETRYDPQTFYFLKSLVTLIHDLDNLTERDPMEEYFANWAKPDQKKQKKMCSACSLNPSAVFPRLKDELRRGLPSLVKSLKELVNDFEQYNVNQCKACNADSLIDLQYVYENLEEARKFVMREGFGIVRD